MFYDAAFKRRRGNHSAAKTRSGLTKSPPGELSRNENENRSHEYFSTSSFASGPSQSLDRDRGCRRSGRLRWTARAGARSLCAGRATRGLYGPLIAVGNYPTPNQHGTGDRMGLFRDGSGTVWGLPLTIDGSGSVLGCAPPGLRVAPVTDTLPAGADIVGATNAPTGWRGGTGELELLFRDIGGEMRWRVIASGALVTEPACWAQEPPGPRQRLGYYRLAPAAP